MTPHTTGEAKLLERLHKMETHNRTRRRACLSFLVVAGIVFLTGHYLPQSRAQGQRQNHVIEADKFVLLDATGAPCAWLMVGEDGMPFLQLKKNGAHARLTLQNGSAGLACGSGHGVSWLGVMSDGPNVNFRGKNLKNGAWLGVQPDLSVGLHLYGETLEVGAKLRVESNGSPRFVLADPDGKQLHNVPVGELQAIGLQPQLIINDAKVENKGRNVALHITVKSQAKSRVNRAGLTITLQRYEGHRSIFKERRDLRLEPVSPGQSSESVTHWDTRDWAPGTYYFYGHVNPPGSTSDSDSWDAFRTLTFDVTDSDNPEARGP